MISALIPVKNFSLGKSRLADALSPFEREKLSALWLEKVLHTLQASKEIDLFGLVTPDPRAAQIGEKYGARIVWEKEPGDLNRAINRATALFHSLGSQSLLVLPADIPWVDRRDIENILARIDPGPKVLICPSKEGTGTNALLRIPPQVIPPRFGPNSFSLHCQEAESRKVPWESLFSPRMAFDIDTPEDLREWQRRTTESKAFFHPSLPTVPG